MASNNGEFGGELITPKGSLYGNFVEVFECCNKTYAIDSCNHMGMGHVKIYTFSDDVKEVELYSTKDFWNEEPSEQISYKALYVNNGVAYI